MFDYPETTHYYITLYGRDDTFMLEDARLSDYLVLIGAKITDSVPLQSPGIYRNEIFQQGELVGHVVSINYNFIVEKRGY